jgi:hypothetical protein
MTDLRAAAVEAGSGSIWTEPGGAACPAPEPDEPDPKTAPLGCILALAWSLGMVGLGAFLAGVGR